MGTRIYGNMSYKPLTTFLQRTMRSGQVRKHIQKSKKNKNVKKIESGGDNFTYTGTRSRWMYIIQIWQSGHVANVIICSKFYRNWLTGFWAMSSQKWGSSIDFDCRPYNRSALPCCLWLCSFIKNSQMQTGSAKWATSNVSSLILITFSFFEILAKCIWQKKINPLELASYLTLFSNYGVHSICQIIASDSAFGNAAILGNLSAYSHKSYCHKLDSLWLRTWQSLL